MGVRVLGREDETMVQKLCTLFGSSLFSMGVIGAKTSVGSTILSGLNEMAVVLADFLYPH